MNERRHVHGYHELHGIHRAFVSLHYFRAWRREHPNAYPTILRCECGAARLTWTPVFGRTITIDDERDSHPTPEMDFGLRYVMR